MGRKDPGRGNMISNLRPITLLNVELKILANVLAKRVPLVTEKLVGEAQTCTISGRTIQNNLHLIRYTIDRIGNNLDMRGDPVHLN